MDLDDLDFLSDYLKNRDKIVLSELEDNDNDDVNMTSTASRVGGEESNVSVKNKFVSLFFFCLNDDITLPTAESKNFGSIFEMIFYIYWMNSFEAFV